jgi:asparagine synthase (glutamine-hydrolysing)
MDQPSADGINTYLISRAARKEGLVAVLSGAGADELHGAYGHARSLAALIRAMNAAGPLRGLLRGLAVTGARWTGQPVRADRLRTLLRVLPSTWQAVQERRRFFTPGQASAIWPAGRDMPAGWAPPYADRESFVARGQREQVRLAEIGGYLLNTLLRDADWATMANQQELRVPFLGRRYMECVLRAPEKMTAAASDAKPQLAALLSPGARELAKRPKRGFTVDYLSWLGGPLAAEFTRAAEVLRDRLGFAVDASAQLEALRASGSQKEARRVWALLTLGQYLESNGLSLAGAGPEMDAAVDAPEVEVGSA